MKPIESKELLRLKLIRLIIEELDETDEETESDEAREYEPGIGRVDIRDLYFPRVQKNWYYDPSVFCRLLGIK